MEYAALLLAVEGYAQAGYRVAAQNLFARGRFRIKKSSNGYPWNFSWYEVRRGTQWFEVLTNAKVRGAFAADEGAYVVDVAVLKGGAMAAAEPLGRAFPGFANADLKTFIESKALVVYPMLLAQFGHRARNHAAVHSEGSETAARTRGARPLRAYAGRARQVQRKR